MDKDYNSSVVKFVLLFRGVNYGLVSSPNRPKGKRGKEWSLICVYCSGDFKYNRNLKSIFKFNK